MSIVDYEPVATAGGANVDTQAGFSGSGYETLGFQTGLAQSKQINKVLRQSSMFSAAWANVISTLLGISILDDGNLAGLQTNILAALALLVATQTKPTTVLKKGSNSGTNYTTASTTFVAVDGTNLSYTVVIPVGWKLLIQAMGCMYEAGGSGSGEVALVDGSTVLEIQEMIVTAGGAPSENPFCLVHAITGDGASHTIQLQMLSNAGSFASLQVANAGGIVPAMVFFLTPSN
jgi:hypothetical protein